MPINRLDTDGQQSVAAGTTALYTHVFHAGSAGQLGFAVAPLTTPPVGWSATGYLDANCNGQLDAGDTPLAAATSVVADQAVCVVVKVFVPETAANETRTTYTLTASFAYANNTLTGQALRQDVTIVGTADGLRLVKSVDKSVAGSGAVITYTLTYLNQGANAVSALKIRDSTPAWTVLGSAACGALPAGITACNVTAQPAAGAAGSVEWTLTGALPSGGTGTVVFTVTVQ